MDIITVDSKADLLAHRHAIEKLFQECFGDRLSADLWHWAYIENPNGEPLVSLCYDEGMLVGHYAIIPMPLMMQSESINSYLSMTIMVAASHRQHGLFVKSADATYAAAKQAGIDIVMGFPNAMSTPGFRKRLNWNLPESDFVASLSKGELLALSRKVDLSPRGKYSLNLNDDSTRLWRLAKPGSPYVWSDGLAYKEFGEAIDLMYFDSTAALDHLPEKKINILVPADISELLPFKLFDYQYGGISISSEFDPAVIVRQMCLSDVF